MSDEETIAIDTSETQMLHAEYKDGQLQIVEVTPFDRQKLFSEQQSDSILPDIITTDGSDGEQQKYLQVMDPNKGLVQLDLLNLTLVRCEDGEESYRLITNAEDGSEIPSDATVTCVLQSSDGEEHDNQDYLMVDGEQGLVFLQSSSMEPEQPQELEQPDQLEDQHIEPQPEREIVPIEYESIEQSQAKKKKPALTPQQILNKAKALQRAKALLATQSIVRRGRRGRRRADDLPPPHELLNSPNFKLYLYSCKLCSFKCNAVKQLQAHRAAEHNSSNKFRVPTSPRGSMLTVQCARCPFRAPSNIQLLKHMQAKHLGAEEGESVEVATGSITFTNKVSLDSKEVEEADVLVCGACGYESGDRDAFRQHIETEHGATCTA
ncbi:hypothetical protein NE865_12604 [Phthorimaea operculella]|nr:hypothetical protein NE865_12604 [Phthorimaea operculella]